MSSISSRGKAEEKKKEILRLIKQGILRTINEPPSSSTADFWSSFLRVKNSTDAYEPFVQCVHCKQILSYESKNGTTSINLHAQSCSKQTNTQQSMSPIETYLRRDGNISSDSRRSVTTACAKYCAFDMRPFNSINGEGFQHLCQVLIDVAYTSGLNRSGKPTAESLLPDRTTVSRTVKQLASQSWCELKETLLKDLKAVKIIGLSSDYWKNTYTGENNLTINIHYTKEDVPVTFMLETSAFAGSKTGENTVRVIKAALSSYGIDPDSSHIIYLTDNASNFVSGLEKEVHLRCMCEYAICPVITERTKRERETSTMDKFHLYDSLGSKLFEACHCFRSLLKSCRATFARKLSKGGIDHNSMQ